MQINVTFRHIDSSDPIREYATEKVDRVVNKYYKRAVESQVILSVTKRRHMADIYIHGPHFDVSAHAITEDMYAAIDEAIDKIEKQLRRHKDRVNHHKGSESLSASATMLDVDVIEAPEEDETGEPRVVETERIPAKPLSVEDAILQLDLAHAEFLVFRNQANDTISVVYKRRDGNYGLIVPTA